jgi:hypothetical protein
MRITLAKNIDKTITLQGKFIKFGNRRKNNKKGSKTTMLLKELELVEPKADGIISHMWIDYNQNFCRVKEGDIIQFTGKVRRYTKTKKLKIFFRSGINRIIKVDYFVDTCDNVKVIENTQGYYYLDKNIDNVITLMGELTKRIIIKNKTNINKSNLTLLLFKDLSPLNQEDIIKIPKLWIYDNNTFEFINEFDNVRFTCKLNSIPKPIPLNVYIEGMNEVIKIDYYFTDYINLNKVMIEDILSTPLDNDTNKIDENCITES